MLLMVMGLPWSTARSPQHESLRLAADGTFTRITDNQPAGIIQLYTLRCQHMNQLLTGRIRLRFWPGYIF